MSDFETLARSFGGIAEEYERARPSYPPEAIETAIRELYLGLDATAVDLGAGTGKLTRLLERRFKRVIAVEPAAEMRAVIEGRQPAVEVLEGEGTSIPVADETADVVFAAQAFHWFATGDALGEIGRVLKPQGGLALIWNTSPWEAQASPWWKRFDEVLQRYAGEAANVRNRTSAEWMAAFDGEQPFAPLRRLTFKHAQRVPLEDFPSVIASRSYVTVLPEDERAALLDELTRLLDDPQAPVGAGQLSIDYETELYLTTLA